MMKLKKDMAKELHQKRRKEGFIKKSYWVHEYDEDRVEEELKVILGQYWQNSELPNNKKSN